MIAKKVTYKGYDGKEIEEVVRLNLTKAECINLDLKYEEDGGLVNYLRRVITTQKEGEPIYKPMVVFLQTVILSAYGKKTDDGKFVKKINGVSLADEFETSEAYSELLVSLLSGEEDLEKFLLGIFPEISEEELSKGKLQIKEEFDI